MQCIPDEQLNHMMTRLPMNMGQSIFCCFRSWASRQLFWNEWRCNWYFEEVDAEILIDIFINPQLILRVRRKGKKRSLSELKFQHKKEKLKIGA